MIATMLGLLAVATIAAAGQPQQTFWALVVNDVPRGEVVAVLDGTDTWLPVTALDEAGLRRLGGQRRTLFNVPHVHLESLAPDLTYRRDMSDVTLRLIAAPRFFDTNVIVLQRDRPDGISHASTPTIYTNYSATWDELTGTTGYGETGLALFGNTSISSAYSFDADGAFSRGLSTMTVDRSSSRLRLQLGDTVSRATPLGSAPIVAGVSIGRDYSLDPYYYRYPTPFVRGTATAPSEVEIFVNGALVRRLDVGPGPYRFDRLPVSAGLGNVMVSVRDPFGARQVYDLTLYQPSGVLRRGEHDFQFVGGRLRDDSLAQPVYGDWQGTALQRVGLADWVTVGYSAEGGPGVVAGGPTLNMRLARFGELELNGWASQTADKTRGVAAYGVYTFVSRPLNINATAQYYDDRFANLFVQPGTISTPEYYQVSAGVPLFSVGSLSYIWEQRRSPAGGFGYTLPDGGFDTEKIMSHSHTARLNVRLWLGLQLTTSATFTRVRDDQIWTGFAGLNLVLGRSGTTVSTNYTRLRDSENRIVDINRSLPIGSGIGFRVTGSDVDGGSASGQLDVNTPFNRLRLNYDVTEGGERRTGSATLSGGLSATRGGFYVTRPLDSSVAVVEVEGLKDVRVLVDNTPVGRTNRRGRLLINQMLPYLANRISYVEEDIPFDFRVPVSWQLVAPPYRGAAYVKFETSKIQARAGSVVFVIGGGRVVPSYGAISVALDGVAVESPLNEAGEFFLDLPVGKHLGVVTFKGQSCQVSFEAKASPALIQQVGELTCTP